MKSKQKPVKKEKKPPPTPSSDSSDDEDDEVEHLGSSPVESKSANRRMSAKAKTTKTSGETVKTKTVSGGQLFDDIRKDNLNQARAVKRHTKQAVLDSQKLIIEWIQAQDDILNDILGNVDAPRQ